VSASPSTRMRRRSRIARGILIPLGVLILAGLVVLALSKLNLHSVGHTLASARPGWVAVALLLMGSSLVLRAVSWRETLSAAAPDFSVGLLAIIRATVIGVMVSALVPGRAGEPARALLVSKRMGSAKANFTLVLGTVFSQTLINIFALLILAVITFTNVSLFQGHESGLEAAIVVPVGIAFLVVVAPRLARRLERARSPKVRHAAERVSHQLVLARRGLSVFARPRHGMPAVAAQLAAWALQWLSCYAVLVALHFTPKATLATAAAVLLAVNVSAVLPATPSNVGVFQLACLLVLRAFGFATAPAIAYGVMLQAVEVVTALAMGIPSLLGEGLSWRDVSHMRQAEEEAEDDIVEALDEAESETEEPPAPAKAAGAQ